jgi:PadR family transcriptional regulator, regulatory protein PadR
VPARRDSSPQTRAVLAALHDHLAQWRYGYDIARQTGLASGTLYPVLARLADRGLLEARWEDDPPEGRPRRHLYRLTAAGATVAAARPAAAATRAGATRTVPRASRRPAAEGT